MIGRHQGGNPLRATGIPGPPLTAPIRMRVLAAGNLLDQVSVQPPQSNLKAVKPKPAASHHETSQPCPRQRV
jgi:hypothetical protein